MEYLERLPELSSFKSCIKFYGRPILPPLVLQPDKNGINEIKELVAATEARLQKQWEQKQEDKIDQEINEHSSKEKESEAELLASGDTLPFCVSANSSSSLEEIREEEEDISTIVIIEESCETKDGQMNEGDGLESKNALPNDAKVFSNNLFDVENSSHFVPSGDKKYPSNFLQDSLCPPHLVTKMKRSRISSVSSETSDDQHLSETECHSLVTVVANPYEDLSSNMDCNSVAQSTDLEKYMDCSMEDSVLSDPSTIVDDAKDVDQCFGTSDVISSEIILSDSNASTPVVPLLLQSPLLDMDYGNMTNPFNHNCLILSFNNYTSKASIGEKDLCENLSNLNLQSTSNNTIQQTMRDNAVQLTMINNSSDPTTPQRQSVGDSFGSDSPKPSRHRRSSSYTVDIPSPVLLKSHANCPCLISPVSHALPHCTSIELKDNSIKPYDMKASPSEKFFGKQTVKRKLEGELGSENSNKAQSGKSPPKSTIPADCSPDHQILVAMSEAFKKAHEERVERLLQEQHEQWLKLESEFKEQELQFQKQIEALKRTSTSGNTSVQSPDNKSWISKQSEDLKSPKYVENHRTTVPKSTSRQLFPDEAYGSNLQLKKQQNKVNSCLKSAHKSLRKGRSSENLSVKVINNPVMQKKFEKVSAAVKGYLTRRLLRTVRLQKLLKTIQDTALFLSSLHEKSGGKLPTETEEIDLHGRLVKQLNGAFREIHEIFFEMTTKQRMEIISQSRAYENEAEKRATTVEIISKLESYKYPRQNRSRLSSATLKRLERKQMKNNVKHEASRMQHSKSADSFWMTSPNEIARLRSRPHTSHSRKSVGNLFDGNEKLNASKRKYPSLGQGSFH